MESPTVPKAEVVSKRYVRKQPLAGCEVGHAISLKSMSMWMVSTVNTESIYREILRMTTSEGMVRLKTCTYGLPRNLFQTRAVSTARVLVLIPPPVDPGEAPINIRRMII